jgi:1-acyl-sn-glycerol-3-phosphate acyltransferase
VAALNDSIKTGRGKACETNTIMADRSLAKRLLYDTIQFSARLSAAALFHVRCSGREYEPREGGALVLANHQSLFDPLIVGLTLNRRMSPLARDTLFRFAPFAWLIRSLDAIPLDREGPGLAGLKEMLRRLKAGQIVLIFPEGTRTPDGEVATLKPGFSALAKRAKVPLLPMGIDGAYQAWPRTQLLPGLATIHVNIGEPIMPAEAQAAEDRELVAEVERRIRRCHRLARQSRLRAMGCYSAEPVGLGVAEHTTSATHVA